jgi:adenylate cyclase
MPREIERKFLVRNDGWREKADQGVLYRQGYISTDPDRSVRVRVAGDRAFLTIKGKPSGSSRDEFEYQIPAQDAREMLDRLCVHPLIKKTRHILRTGELKWEIDEFAGANQDLIVAEIELKHPEQQFEMPQWIGEEVTGDPRYYNLNLIKHPYSEWAPGRSK